VTGPSPGRRNTPKPYGSKGGPSGQGGNQGAYNSKKPFKPGMQNGRPYKPGAPARRPYGGAGLPAGGRGLAPGSHDHPSQRGGRRPGSAFGGQSDPQEGGTAEDGAPAGPESEQQQKPSIAAFGWANASRPAPGIQASNRSATGSVSSVGSSYRSTYSGKNTGAAPHRGFQDSGFGRADPALRGSGGVGDRSPANTNRMRSQSQPAASTRRRRPGQVDPGEMAASPGSQGGATETEPKPPPGTKTEGTVRFADGSLYTGELMDGQRHGKGTYRSAVGTFFEGMWAHGKRNGHGIEKYPIGNVYEGDWQEDQKHGYGVVRASAAPPTIPASTPIPA
jgi:hypothetical protein